jgi:hypothetical protein
MIAVTSNCAFCRENRPLRESHLLPRWIIERALEKSPTGRMRDADAINKPVQDGEKLPLLCSACEERFGKLETMEARNHDDGKTIAGSGYERGFCRFVVSVLWRVGVSRVEQLRSESPKFLEPLTAAVTTWKEYLDGERQDLGRHRAQFLFLDKATAKKIYAYREDGLPAAGPAPVLHRYLLNSLNTELALYEQDEHALVWVMGNSWLMVGVIEVPVEEGQPSLIDLSPTGGTFPVGNFDVPPIILATLRRQSWRYFDEHRQISPKQRQKMQEFAARRADEFTDRSQSEAKDADTAMFGEQGVVELSDDD